MAESREPALASQAAKDDHAKIGEIQVLRGIAILSVLFCHLSITSSLLEKSPSKITMPLYLGVELFFIISGFVITNSLMRDQFSGTRFFIKRVFRLIPTLLVLLAVAYAINQYFQRSSPSEHAKNLFSVRESVFWKQSLGILGGYFVLTEAPAAHCYSAMWSLSIEDQFYAVLAVMCLLASLLGSRRKNVIAPVIFATAVGFYASLSAIRLGRCFGIGVENKVLSYLLQWRFEFLGLGIALAFANTRFKHRFCQAFEDRGNFIAPVLLLVTYGLACLCDRNTPGAAPLFSNDSLLLVCGVLFGLLVLLAANGLALPRTRGPVFRTMLFFGDRSYTLYVMHYSVFVLAWLIIASFMPSAFSSPMKYGYWQLALTTAILLPLVELIYRFVELPLSRFGRRLAGSLAKSDGETPMQSMVPQQSPLRVARNKAA